jgi:hypothetical protein
MADLMRKIWRCEKHGHVLCFDEMACVDYVPEPGD